jgi:hypothetical protein
MPCSTLAYSTEPTHSHVLRAACNSTSGKPCLSEVSGKQQGAAARQLAGTSSQEADYVAAGEEHASGSGRHSSGSTLSWRKRATSAAPNAGQADRGGSDESPATHGQRLEHVLGRCVWDGTGLMQDQGSDWGWGHNAKEGSARLYEPLSMT